jgi:hypothetical protein
MEGTMVSILYHVWFIKAASRKEAAASHQQIPAWGLSAWLAGYILSICLYLRCKDRGWLYFREVFSMEEHIERSSTVLGAYERGFRSLNEYDYMEYLNREDLARRRRLLQGNPLLALPEGRESVLAKEITRIEKESNSGCGCYFELYHARLLRGLRALNTRLTEYDRAIFNGLLSASGWDISDESYEVARREESEVWAEIRADYE